MSTSSSNGHPAAQHSPSSPSSTPSRKNQEQINSKNSEKMESDSSLPALSLRYRSYIEMGLCIETLNLKMCCCLGMAMQSLQILDWRRWCRRIRLVKLKQGRWYILHRKSRWGWVIVNWLIFGLWVSFFMNFPLQKHHSDRIKLEQE